MNESYGRSGFPPAYLDRVGSSFTDFLAATSPDLLPGRRPVPQLPVSEIAPHGTTIVAATYAGGVLMGGVSGVYAAKVVVLGAGVSGLNAAAIALGMQAEVLLLDKNIGRLREVDRIYQGHMQTVASNTYEIERAVIDADLVIGAVLVPGAKAPVLVSDDLVAQMKPGSVLFIPRGTWHRTTAAQDSFAISIGIRPPSVLESFLEQLRYLLLQDPEWRRPLYGAHGSGSQRQQALERARKVLQTAPAAVQAIPAGITTPSPRIDAAVVTPTRRPSAASSAPPANPSCIGADVRMTCSIARR